MADLGSFGIAAIEEIGTDEMAAIVKRISTCCDELVARLASIVVECDSRKDAADFMPPVLSHQLVQLRGRDFTDIIRKQKNRMSARWSQQSIELIEQAFQELRVAYKRKTYLKKVMDKCDVKLRLKIAGTMCNIASCTCIHMWRIEDRVPGHAYCYTVESKFSIVKWTKDDCWIGLT